MALFKAPNVDIKGISACVPPTIERTADIPFYSEEKAKAITASTGVIQKHIAEEFITSSDLCITAAKTLLKELDWASDTIDIIVFVTQTSDYENHPNGFVAHDALGLKGDCIVMDLFHGCPGWVMGLMQIVSMMNQAGLKRGLLLAGDCLTHTHYKLSSETRPLFGDAGSATALEVNENSDGFIFDTGTLSKDGLTLVSSGGKGRARNPFTPETFLVNYELRKGLRAAPENESQMDGMSVFAFGISKPPKSIKKILAANDMDINAVDKFVFHQANKLMVDTIVKKLKIPSEKAPLSLRDFGNTVSASIPLTIVSECREDYASGIVKSVCCGFGTGLSWASTYFKTDRIACPPIITYKI